MRLKKMAYGHKTEHRLRVRAQVVLHAAHGRSNACIARETGLHLNTVRRWRGRFAQAGLPGLKDRQRCGRPASFTPLQAAEVKALACRLPAESEVPLSRWSCPELAREAARRGIAPFMSASTVRRWLAQDALKPWQHRSWIFTTSPGFRLKAAWVLDLYARTWQGEQLGDDEYVISADEKTSIQARCRCHPTLAPGKARAMRVNHTYGRGGALAYLAAYDVHDAWVFGRTEERTGIVPFMNLATQVMSQEPYASAKRVFWIVGNGSSHRGQKAADRLTAAFPNTVMVHTPCTPPGSTKSCDTKSLEKSGNHQGGSTDDVEGVGPEPVRRARSRLSVRREQSRGAKPGELPKDPRSIRGLQAGKCRTGECE
ncbi:IS630 family transposase [Streptomyces lunaelactis]|uniref:IS630 family transposase n=2 Tax=Streptomyces lunaelactis TaxID=1535768 RepID=UPI0028156A0D|nr:IS630 family transposase [Streptomyces lunaelactis]